MSRPELRPGDVFIYASDAFPSFEDIRNSFDVFIALDTCAAIEAAVLNERILIVGTNIENPVLEALIREGVAVQATGHTGLSVTPDEIKKHPLSSLLLKAAEGSGIAFTISGERDLGHLADSMLRQLPSRRLVSALGLP